MVTPLQPKEFFQGVWTGAGELRPRPWARPFVPRQGVRLTSEAEWLTDTVWVVRDRFEFSTGQVLRRRMYAELVAPDRVHVTADDLPLGTDILLREDGFFFLPYDALAPFAGRHVKLHCRDECRLDRDGCVHDTIEMSFRGVPVATLRIGPIRIERAPAAASVTGGAST
jgi:hypothetical protein